LILVLLAPFIPGDATVAARDLARAVAGAVASEAVTVSLKNVSSLSPADAAEIRREFESELKVAGTPAVEVHLTLSENLTEYLMVAEIGRDGERQVLLESWPRMPAASAPQNNPARVTLEKKLMWEQDQPILDAAKTDGAMLLLDRTRVLLVRGDERQSVPIPATHPWPRDIRGRLSISGVAFTAYLPGAICRGSTEPRLSIACLDSQDPWLLGPGAIALFSPDRNLFSGHIDVEPGGPRDLPPFYSAAPAGGAWIFAAADGRAQVYTSNWEPAAGIDQWGSDIAAIQTPCGARILATRRASLAAPDAVQPFDLAPGAVPSIAGPPIEFSGPITALWSAGSSATAVSRDLQTGRYAAFILAPSCGS
jgi:hypothetical protein